MGFGSGFGTGWGGGGAGAGAAPTPAFKSPIYQIPFNVVLGSVPVGRFSGEPQSGPLSGASGLLFFSPSLIQETSGNEIDVAEISVSSAAADEYSRPAEEAGTRRYFRFGPATTDSRTNSAVHRTVPREFLVTAVMVQTIPPGPTTTIRVGYETF